MMAIVFKIIRVFVYEVYTVYTFDNFFTDQVYI